MADPFENYDSDGLADRVTVRVEADTEQFKQAMNDARQNVRELGNEVASALQGAVKGGEMLEDTIRQIALSFAEKGLTQAFSPLQATFGDVADTVFGGFAERVAALAFRNERQAAAAGQAGFSSSALGFVPNRPDAVSNVVLNVATADAGSFGRSEGQLAAILARLNSRGLRRL